jgi:tetratricopeptide (TPR) repeat protein
VLVVPGVEAPGFLHVDGRLLDFKAACAELEAAGAKHAGRLAALLDLEPEAVTLAGSLLRAGNEERNIESAVRTAADPAGAIKQLATNSGVHAGARPGDESGEWHDSVEALLLDRRADKRSWVNAAREAIGADDAEVAALWARRGLLLGGEDREALQVAGQALGRVGAYSEAETLLRRSVDLAEAAGSPDQAYADPTIDLALILWNEGRLKDAEKLLRRAVAIARRARGVAHLDYATAIRSLAIVLRDRGRHAEAESLLRESAAITRRNEGKMHPRYATIINDLGTVLLASGKRGAAESLFRESLMILERTLGPESSHYAAAAHALGRCLIEQQKYPEAEKNLRIALAIRAKILGENNPAYATSLHELARSLLGQGAYGEAAQELRRALSIFERSIGVENPYYAATLHQLADILLYRGDYATAEQVFRASLKIEQAIFGAEDPSLCATLNNLGFALASQGQFSEGEALVARSTEIARECSSHHPGVGVGLLTLARMQAARGSVEAPETARRALDALRKSFGPKAPERTEAAQLLESLIGAREKR